VDPFLSSPSPGWALSLPEVEGAARPGTRTTAARASMGVVAQAGVASRGRLGRRPGAGTGAGISGGGAGAPGRGSCV